MVAGADVGRAGEFDAELLEAVALVTGVYGGAVFIPATFVGTDPHEVRREMCGIFDKISVEVSHIARYTTVAQNGTTLYEGLSFVNQGCPIKIKVGCGSMRTVPSTPGEGL